MAGQVLEFSLVRNLEELSLSPNYRIPFELPMVHAGETLSFRIYIAAPDLTKPTGSLKPLDPTGLGLRIAVGSPGNILNSATLVVAGSPGDQYFSGSLSLAVSGVTDLFPGDSAIPVEKTIEFEISDAGVYQKVQFPLTIKNQLITVSLVDPEPTDTALGKREAASSYLPLDNQVNGGGHILRNASGARFFIYVGNDETLHCEKLP